MRASAAVVSRPRCFSRVRLVLPLLAGTYNDTGRGHLPTLSTPNTRRYSESHHTISHSDGRMGVSHARGH